MALGERIKECRQNTGLSQEKVAELVGVSRQAVTKWEMNQSAPNTENLFKYLFVISTSSWLNCLFISLAHFLIVSFIITYY